MLLQYQTPVSSLWPEAVHASNRRAREFYIARIARWLNLAGAEPRFGMVLTAGADARQALNDGLEVSGIRVVSVQCTEKTLYHVIRTHTGDHFNSTLLLDDSTQRRLSMSYANSQR